MITVVDFGVSNILSVVRGLEYCGAKVSITSDPMEIANAEKLVLPGVGAYRNAMQALESKDIVPAIREVAERGKAILGICLGMQLLLDESEEFGITQGLGLISGRVVHVPSWDLKGEPLKSPSIGWNELLPSPSWPSWDKTLLKGVKSTDSVYFVHSYMVETVDQSNCVAQYVYGGHRLTAVVSKDNVSGCQFHPEKSGEVGLKILGAFCAN